MSKPFSFAGIPLIGTAVVEASAGTGKTYSIACIYLRLVIERGLTPRQILVVTYTRAATAELKIRIRSALLDAKRMLDGEKGKTADPFIVSLANPDSADAELRRARILEAIVSFDEAAICTIHSFCQKSIRDNAFEYSVAFDSSFTADINEIIENGSRDFFRSRIYKADRYEAIALNACGLGDTAVFSMLFSKIRSKGDLTFVQKPGLWKKVHSYVKSAEKDFAKAQDAWNEHRDSFFAVLEANRDKLNGTRYGKSNKFEKWMRDIDTFFGRFTCATPDESTAAYLEKISARTIEENCKAEIVMQLTEHPLARAVQKFYEEYTGSIEKIIHCADSLMVEFIDYAKERIRTQMDSQGLMSFDDLVRIVHRGVTGSSGERIIQTLRAAYPAVLVDEFQDTDSVQAEIFETVFADRENLLLYIGDPKQAIFSFRGADVYAYISIRDRKGRTLYTMQENFRSHGVILDTVEKLFSSDDPFCTGGRISLPHIHAARNPSVLFNGTEVSPVALKTLSCRVKSGKAEKNDLISVARAREKIAQSITNECVKILTLAKNGKAEYRDASGRIRVIRPSDIAILVLKNHDARFIQSRLSEGGIPSVIASGQSVYDTVLHQEFLSVLRAIVSEKESFVRAALATNICGYSANDINGFSDSAWEDLLSVFRSAREQWSRGGFARMFTSFCDTVRAEENLIHASGGLRSIADFRHLSELYQESAIQHGYGADELIEWGERMCGKPVDSESSAQQRIETDDNAVRIITIHKSKGLEFPIVFDCSGWEGLPSGRGNSYSHSYNFYHDADGKSICDFTSSRETGEGYAKGLLEESSERLRLFYVSCTRAGARLYLFACETKQCHESPLAYLLFYDKAVEKIKDLPLAEKKAASVGHIKSMTDSFSPGFFAAAIRERVKNLSVEISEIDESIETFESVEDRTQVLESEPVTRMVMDTWKVSSFSHIVSSRDDRDIREGEGAAHSSAGTDEEPDFPKGSRPGSALHSVFEEIDFQNPESDENAKLIESILSRFDIKGEPYTVWTRTMISRVLHAKLPLCTASLSSLPSKALIREMEFYLPANWIECRPFTRLLRAELGDSFNNGVNNNLYSLEFPAFEGYLKGYIDLVFQSGDRYYIVDWKSNFLGNSVSAYGVKDIAEAMDEHLYTAQALIYAVALHRYLRTRCIDYSYEKNFGGVIYLFLRGVDGESGTGIWPFRPAEKSLDALADFFTSVRGTNG